MISPDPRSPSTGGRGSAARWSAERVLLVLLVALAGCAIGAAVAGLGGIAVALMLLDLVAWLAYWAADRPS